MKLVSFVAADEKVRPGALFEAQGQVADLSAAGYSDALSVIAAGVTSAEASLPTFKWAEVKLLAPLVHPPRIFAIGLNYREHAIETGAAFPHSPVVFFKLQTAITGPDSAIILPKNSHEPDYEVELAVVIGKGGYRIPAEDWREHVYGYTIVNDVSARDIQRSTSQWSMAKSFPTFCPMGPAITTADEVADPHQLAISLAINGEVLQNSKTSELIFKIPQLIEYLSSIAPLLPGDVISTGTPSGVGMGRTPKRWIQPGEKIVAKIDGLGELANTAVAEAPAVRLTASLDLS
ncbi:fumarylacetoacetate hydrolase family protein [Telmatobacter bradus]|uniref:fumarylacetoacetate hydrolase family protein n=1 Tax=Telmatobacter bradus TaxID=474953 RepID=UPI003B43618D